MPSRAIRNVLLIDRKASRLPWLYSSSSMATMSGNSVSGGTGSSRLRFWLSLGIACTPKSDEALFLPNCFCILTWLSRNEGLWEKKIANAESAASCMR